MSLSSIVSSFKAGGNHILARITQDLNSHRYLWNYIYMTLYVFIAIWLTIFHANTCGTTVITVTGGVVTGIFTNAVWSKVYEKKNKESKNEPTINNSKVNSSEDGASA